MKGFSPRTWQLVQRLFPVHAETAGLMIIAECGQNLRFCQDSLDKLQEAIDDAEQDWRDVLVWAGFADRLDAHLVYARQVLGE